MNVGEVRVQKVAVEDFYNAGKERLELELVSGKGGMNRPIIEPAVNRPGLALTGFFQYFAHRRIQVFGHAEHAFLSSLHGNEIGVRLKAVFAQHIPCVVVTRHRKPLRELVELGDVMNVPVMRSPMVTGRFVNAATIIMEDLKAPRQLVQGTMVEILGIGVLITGRPGVGKSETALGLIKKGHSLVADDLTELRLDSSGVLIGSALEVTRYHMELRGVGIVHVPSLFGVAAVRAQKKLDFIIHLEPMEIGRRAEDSIAEGGQKMVEILGVQVPKLTIPVSPGRDVVDIVEAAALDLKLKWLGHDAAKELDAKLIAGMREGVAGRE